MPCVLGWGRPGVRAALRAPGHPGGCQGCQRSGHRLGREVSALSLPEPSEGPGHLPAWGRPCGLVGGTRHLRRVWGSSGGGGGLQGAGGQPLRASAHSVHFAFYKSALLTEGAVAAARRRNEKMHLEDIALCQEQKGPICLAWTWLGPVASANGFVFSCETGC